MARLGDIALLEKPTGNRSPKRIDCYQVVERSSGDDPALRPVLDRHWLEIRRARVVFPLQIVNQARRVEHEGAYAFEAATDGRTKRRH
jgi:hypothetical protein